MELTMKGDYKTEKKMLRTPKGRSPEEKKNAKRKEDEKRC